MKKIMSGLAILCTLYTYASAADSLRSSTKELAQLCVSIQSVTPPTNGDTKKYKTISHSLKYSNKENYYWYQLKKDWAVGQECQLVIKQLPPNGFLYIFTVDGMNTPEMLGLLNLDSVHKAGRALPFTFNTLTLKYAGQERLCMWYAKNIIDGYEAMAMGIEFTHGDFTTRNRLQLGSRLLAQSNYWNLTKKEIGFIARQNEGEIPETAVLPIIIEFEIH